MFLPCNVALIACPVRLPSASNGFSVTVIALQCAAPSGSDKHFTSPVTMARSCENTIPDNGDVPTSIFCCFGKNLYSEIQN